MPETIIFGQDGLNLLGNRFHQTRAEAFEIRRALRGGVDLVSLDNFEVSTSIMHIVKGEDARLGLSYNEYAVTITRGPLDQIVRIGIRPASTIQSSRSL